MTQRTARTLIALSATTADDGPQWNQLFPAGQFMAIDGRGPFFMDGHTANKLIALHAKRNPLSMDYDHQTLTAAKAGNTAPASGWIKQLAWRAGEGLFALIEWTDKARAAIRAREYRYISPMFAHQGKQISELMPCALTNYAGIDGMQPVAASATLYKDPYNMDELLKALRAKLKLADDATHEQMLEAFNQWVAGMDEKKPKVETEAMSASVITAMTAMQREVVALKGEIAGLRQQAALNSIESQIDGAMQDGRLLPTLKTWAVELGASNPAALSAFLSATKPIAALSGMQTAGAAQSGTSAKASDEEINVAKSFGLTSEEYVAAKKQFGGG